MLRMEIRKKPEYVWKEYRKNGIEKSSRAVESRLKGVNRTKLKFTKLITTTSRVSVRNINESEREGAKQIARE
jgi:hypothetical protein